MLRPAGVLTQLCSAACLLLGTIAFVLVKQNGTGGTGLVIAWAVAAMAGLVFGGLMSRGGLVSLFVSATLDVAFGIVLLVIDYPTLRGLLRVLPESDVGTIADLLVGLAITMGVTSMLCLLSVGQARRYARAFREAVEAAAQSDASLAQSFPAMPAQPAPPYTPMPVATPGTFGGTSGGASMAMPRAAPEPALGAAPPAVDPTTPIIPSAASTARGWAPAPARTHHTTMMIIRPPAEEARSRRRIYIALGGFAIGVGLGIGVLVSSSATGTGGAPRAASGLGSAHGSAGGSDAPTAHGSAGPGPGPVVVVASGSGSGSGSGAGSGSRSGSGSAAAARPDVSVRTLITAQRDAIKKGDAKALADLTATNAFAFGIDGDDVVEGRTAIEEMLVKHVGDAPPGGFTVESKFLSIGQELTHAWTAEDLELSGPGVATRRLSITQLAVFVAGRWTVIAMHWGRPVPDALAERMAILGTLPRAKAIPNRHDGDDGLDKAVREAFGSRRAFADARSEREDGFNFGSGPGERVVGGAAIKRLFGRLHAELRLEGGARVVSGDVWDPSQKSAPYIGWAAVNVTWTQKGQAATDVTQTFRVLAILVREGASWTIVQTQFSNAGPIR